MAGCSKERQFLHIEAGEAGWTQDGGWCLVLRAGWIQLDQTEKGGLCGRVDWCKWCKYAQKRIRHGVFAGVETSSSSSSSSSSAHQEPGSFPVSGLGVLAPLLSALPSSLLYPSYYKELLFLKRALTVLKIAQGLSMACHTLFSLSV